MPEFNATEVRILRACVARFAEEFTRTVARPVGEQFRGYEPAEVKDLIGQLALLTSQLESARPTVVVHDAQNPLLKRVLIEARRATAFAIEEPLQHAAERGAVRHVRRELEAVEALLAAPWFAAATPLRLPRLSDYVSLRAAEAVGAPPPLRPREYDEKFRILEAPGLFLPDLAHYRARCALRELPVAVAFVDIDDFKAFNTRLTETVVDLEVLAPFMETIEAHVFAHGHAYRFGGDEYVLTLPNAGRERAVGFLRALQDRLAQRRYRRVEHGPGVSIGLCVVAPDCWLTEREIQARANVAKQHAKASEKGRIALYEGELFRPEDLVLA
jgi:diguanylate cyclase (GGDEF)-like protein